ncbi:hypothetical protein [Haloechinothrix sp. LS1_15]|uniref:hypothetical protein n=1 Tax=Haloechinothrix sp. LS1_15 TaxID=2652248 RepID=UPI002946DA23|nr:hypothetical protein [Haloechinothrix sp. LS1_15]MDV6011892.1 hypothetical protein [Haloechinothrix sp. LS1_15]
MTSGHRFATIPRSPLLAVAAALALTASTLAAAPQAVAAGEDTGKDVGSDTGGSVCDRFGEGEAAGTVTDPVVEEASGIVASRAHDGVFWTHNDSGHEPELYALSTSAEMLGAYPVAGAENIDWEDIATGPGPEPGIEYLYVGDIGANFNNFDIDFPGAELRRDEVVVYRVAEPETRPDGTGGELDVVDELRFTYPDGIIDAEAMFVDPHTGDLYILTKPYLDSLDENGVSQVMRAAAADLRPGEAIMMTEVAEFDAGPAYDFDRHFPPPSPLPGGMVTGADISPDGSTILVRTYQEILAFERSGSVAEAFRGEPCYAPQVPERQGEAVGFTVGGDAYVTISEGRFPDLNRMPVSPPLAADG